MAKVKIQNLPFSERDRITQEFAALLHHLRSKEEMGDVLIGLMTPSEVIMFSRRVQIAKEMLRGETQDSIRRKLKVGFNTMQSVADWLYTGDRKRDQWLAKEIMKIYKAPVEKYSLSKSSLDRYPEHRLMRQILAKFIS